MNFQRTDLSVFRLDDLTYHGAHRQAKRLDLLPIPADRRAGSQWTSGNGTHVPRR